MATRRCDWGDAFERMRAYIDATMHEHGRDASDDATGEELVGRLPLGRGVEVLHVRVRLDERIVPDACRNDEAEPSEGEGEECQVALPAHAACSLTC